jgi:type I restriction enzyme, S subunit
MTNWSLLPIGAVCRLVNGRAFKPSDWTAEGLPIVRIQNLNDQTKPFNRYDGPVDPRVLIGSGDILLSWSGTPGTSFGCFVWDRGPAILNQHIFRVHVDQARIDRDFFVHAVNSKLEEMISLAHGGVGLRHITKGKLEGIQVPVPPLAEQRRIVARIEECTSRIDEIQELRAQSSVEVHALQGAIINSVVRNDWPRRSLAEACLDIRNGWSGKQPEDGQTVSVLRLSCVHSLTIDEDDAKSVRVGKPVVAEFGLRAGDVFVVRGNGSRHLVGRSAIAARDSRSTIFNDLLIRLRPRPDVLPAFLNYALHSSDVREALEGASKTAAGIWKINQQNLGKVQVPVPGVAAQRLALNVIDEALGAVRGIVDVIPEKSVTALGASVLRKAFAGEL